MYAENTVLLYFIPFPLSHPFSFTLPSSPFLPHPSICTPPPLQPWASTSESDTISQQVAWLVPWAQASDDEAARSPRRWLSVWRRSTAVRYGFYCSIIIVVGQGCSYKNLGVILERSYCHKFYQVQMCYWFVKYGFPS